MDLILPILLSWIVCALLMFVLWRIQLRTNNASYIDVGWALGIALSTLILSFYYPGDQARKFLVLAMIFSWAFRLNYHLIVRIIQENHEDKRYQQLRRDWQKNLQLKFFFMFQFQAFLSVILATVFIAPLNNASISMMPLEFFALLLWFIAFWGESIADMQLKVFKANPHNKGKTCNQGLWHYSRHPNYFFEWVMWVAYALFGLASPLGWVGLLAPMIMWVFLLKLTGVPFAEQMALKTRGEEYRRYQASTSMFIPWFKRRVD